MKLGRSLRRCRSTCPRRAAVCPFHWRSPTQQKGWAQQDLVGTFPSPSCGTIVRSRTAAPYQRRAHRQARGSAPQYRCSGGKWIWFPMVIPGSPAPEHWSSWFGRTEIRGSLMTEAEEPIHLTNHLRSVGQVYGCCHLSQARAARVSRSHMQYKMLYRSTTELRGV
jgi:hypothetical protein